MDSPEADDEVYVAAVVHGIFEEPAGLGLGTRSLEPCARVVEVVGSGKGGAEGRETAVLPFVGDGEAASKVWTQRRGFGELLGLGEVDA